MRNRCSYAGLVSAYFSVYLAGTKNVSTNTIYSYRDTFVIFHGYLEKYCGFKLNANTVYLLETNDLLR